MRERERTRRQRQKEIELKEKQKEKKLQVREKEKQRPKKIRSPYTFFVQERMPLVRSQVDSMKKAMLLVSQSWKELPQEEKAKYHKYSEDDAKRKEKEMITFNSLYPKPKRELSEWTKYFQRMFPIVRKDHPNQKVPMIMKSIAQQWKQKAL